MIFITKLLHWIHRKYKNVQKRTSLGVQSAKGTAFRGGVIVILMITIVWISIFLYTSFYYTYMPNISHVRPVHLNFKYCSNLKGICSFPSDDVVLTEKKQLLMVGQPYRINLHLEMPESPANKDLGMFMVCATLKSEDDKLYKKACRSAMLHYKSKLLNVLTTLTYLPMMIFGKTEEKQNIDIELFKNFEENQNHPAKYIYVEIQSTAIELYSASLIINAHLSGLRYLMFHWPILSAIGGICTSLFFITLVCTLSLLRFVFNKEITDDDFGYEPEESENFIDLDSNENNESSFTDKSINEDVFNDEE